MLKSAPKTDAFSKDQIEIEGHGLISTIMCPSHSRLIIGVDDECGGVPAAVQDGQSAVLVRLQARQVEGSVPVGVLVVQHQLLWRAGRQQVWRISRER